MPLYLAECKSNNEQNMLGVLPGMYHISHPITRYGLYSKQNHLYLVMPNCWKDRNWHIKSGYSALLGEEQSEEHALAEAERINALSKAMNFAIDLGVEREM